MVTPEENSVRKRTTVRLDAALIDALRRVARKLSYVEQKDLDWIDVLEAAGRRAVQDAGEQTASTSN